MTNETHSITPIIDLNNEIQTTNETNSTIEATPDDSAFDWDYFTPAVSNVNVNTVTPVSIFQPATNLNADFEQEVNINSVNNLNDAFDREAARDPRVHN